MVLSDIFAKELSKEYSSEMMKMQFRYDSETNHSTNRPLQHYWEYKIDSLHTSLTQKKGFVEDEFSGIRCQFPDLPTEIVHVDTGLVFRGFSLEKYSMRFRFITRYDSYVDTSLFAEDFSEFLKSAGFINIKKQTENWRGKYMLETICEDTTYNRKFYDRIIYDYPYNYQLTVFIPLDIEDDAPYIKMKDHFFNSFRVDSLESYWIKKIDTLDSSGKLIEATASGSEKNTYSLLCSGNLSDFSIIYKTPFFNDKRLIIPFRVVKHKFDEIDDILLKVNNERIFSQAPDSIDQIISLNMKVLEAGKNDIQFGYTLKADSTKDCYFFYKTSFEVFNEQKSKY